MNEEESKKVQLNFKKAIPLMVKNGVSPSPQNYALWYTYVENSDPDLNQEIDDTLDSLGHCPPTINDELYQRYIASKSEADLKSLRKNIEVMLQELSSSMTDVSNDTQSFSQLMDKSFSQLEKADREKLSLDEVMFLVRQLISESKEIRHSAHFLNSSLSSASEEINKLKEQLSSLQHSALTDALTGVGNRRAFDQDILTFIQTEVPFSLIILDIDHFKQLNDNYGHLFGDSVLKVVAKRVSPSENGYQVYRYGGEEFAIIVPNKKLRSTRQLADTLRRSIEKLRIKDRKSGQLVSNVTASFGVTEYDASLSLAVNIGKADELLYQAKTLGRNRVMPL
ncbi:GGDEF domain-containing protein [Vibrio salinus]|uniref:GGDEF domain-containing protein n=1 Tax=Vibrio salinus TaxID=2899784 RepID=UPI001E454AB9|nr:GGDEF domain-containing protein [Vibrio salinus]MCE0493623.1 GGDEF domain-containing protein [Vibrio salinus]